MLLEPLEDEEDPLLEKSGVIVILSMLISISNSSAIGVALFLIGREPLLFLNLSSKYLVLEEALGHLATLLDF